jgi:hypothetical protein
MTIRDRLYRAKNKTDQVKHMKQKQSIALTRDPICLFSLFL